jgi:hypothetical protein
MSGRIGGWAYIPAPDRPMYFPKGSGTISRAATPSGGR